jgi:hypothetical protein
MTAENENLSHQSRTEHVGRSRELRPNLDATLISLLSVVFDDLVHIRPSSVTRGMPLFEPRVS